MMNCLDKDNKVVKRLKESDIILDSTQKVRQIEFDNIFIQFLTCGVFVVKLFWMVTKTMMIFYFVHYYFLVQIIIFLN